MRIIDLREGHRARIRQAARLLVEGFREGWPNAWPDLDSAHQEVMEALQEDRLCRVALDEGGRLLGWIGAIPQYDGHVWEIHPLVVDPQQQRLGIGRALVQDVEALVRDRGGLTLWVGSDDETGLTSLTDVDLYTDPWTHIRAIRNVGGHPYQFYARLGFVIVGVVPDANGIGKPDILMAKPVR